MTFSEVLEQILVLLQQQGRFSYSVLKQRFELDDAYLSDLKDELIDALRVARDEHGKALVWIGETGGAARPLRTPLPVQAPASYTPAHLARRIRAEQTAMETRGQAEGERKTITALFADLKGSTAVIEGLDAY